MRGDGCLRARAVLMILAAAACLAAPARIHAQPGRGGQPATPAAPRAAAPIDLSGYWVSVVTEDWRYRMVMPPKGDFASVPLNDEGRKVVETWDPARDEASGDTCKAYGAANIMRVPGRFHITWADDRTLKIETDAGQQTRLLKFAPVAGPAGLPSRQGNSVAQWERKALRVETSNLLPGYLQYNGVPHSGNLRMLEFVDVISEPGGELWLIDDEVMTDPQNLVRPHKRSTHLRKQADGKGWDPQPCLVR